MKPLDFLMLAFTVFFALLGMVSIVRGDWLWAALDFAMASADGFYVVLFAHYERAGVRE